MDKNYSFPRTLRLLTSSDFDNVFSNSKRIGSPSLTLIVKNNQLSYPRIGFAIAKKQIKRAHERNRLKRLMREFIRLNQHNLPHFDMIMLAKNPAQFLSNSELTALFGRLIARSEKNINPK